MRLPRVMVGKSPAVGHLIGVGQTDAQHMGHILHGQHQREFVKRIVFGFSHSVPFYLPGGRVLFFVLRLIFCAAYMVISGHCSSWSSGLWPMAIFFSWIFRRSFRSTRCPTGAAGGTELSRKI